MNRRQRRTTAKTKRPAAPAPRETPEAITVAKPGIVLRLIARILLAPWVLKRVKHADVERVLAGVAVQAGRPEIAADLLNRSAIRNEGKP